MKRALAFLLALAAVLCALVTPVMAEESADTARVSEKLVSDFPMEMLIGAIAAVLLICVVLFFIFRKKK